MIFQNIETVQNSEAAKDAAFMNLVGRGLDNSLEPVESLRQCEAYRSMYRQPAIFDIANNRPFTDSVLCPSHYDWDEAQSFHIAELKGKYESVVVTDQEIRELRLESLNSLSQGDASQKILRTKILKMLAITGAELEIPEIRDALYCARQGVSLYFFDRVI